MQAAVMYDHQRHMRRDGAAFPVYELVADTDRGEFGLCRCTEQGDVEQLELVASAAAAPAQMWRDRLAAGGHGTAEELAALPGDDRARQRLWTFYSTGRRSDGPAFALADGTELLCSELDAAFDPVRRPLEQALQEMLDRIEARQIPEESLRILAVGVLANAAPLRLSLRSQLCLDPFLADDRFVELAPDEDPAAIVEEGRALYARTRVVGVDLDLLYSAWDGSLLTEADGGLLTMELARSHQPVQTMQTPRYSLPIFVSVREGLRLTVDGKLWQQALPYDVSPAEQDLIQVACVMREGKPRILVRRALAPTAVYEIDLGTGKEMSP